MGNRFTLGCDELKDGGDHKTWGITDTRSYIAPLFGNKNTEWVNRIEIHSPNPALRDWVLKTLNEAM